MKIQRSPRPRSDAVSLARELAQADLAVLAERLDAVHDRLDGAVVSDPVAEHEAAAAEARRDAEVRVPAAGTPEDLVAAIAVLAAGRQHVAHLEAYVTAESPPDERPPCLFDPAHGPSVTDASWTSVRYGTRRVPVCLHDAVMLAAGVPPECRRVEVEGRRVAYWEAGEEVQPYLDGYFPNHALLAWMRDPGTRLPRRVFTPHDSTYGDTAGWRPGG